MEEREARRVILGRVAGLHGVRGWVKVLSYTEPRGNILSYPRWQLRTAEGWRAVALAAGQSHGDRVRAQFESVSDRDQAATLVGAEIAVMRTEMPAVGAGEYYWSDLEGLSVRNLAGVDLGRVAQLFSTGANDVMVVQGERERLLPFLPGTVVTAVDLAHGEIRVDWDADF
jgi:16S rRNA processing protein RimM